MKLIKPIKGISSRLIVKGLYENYFIIMCGSATLVIVLLLVFYESLSIRAFIILFSCCAVLLLGMYFYFRRQTKRGEVKQYPKGSIRISNKNFW